MEKSMAKYEVAGEAGGQAMADIKLNLAIAYYRVRRFDDSRRLHLEALSSFQKAYGDGVNPFMQRLDRYDDASNQQSKQQKRQNWLQNKNPQQSKTNNNNRKEEGEEKGTGGAPGTETVVGNVIDLDQYISSIKNATVSAATVKEEL
jgi:Tetratricopeptide repeat